MYYKTDTLKKKKKSECEVESTKYSFPFLNKITALPQNVANCQNKLTVLTLKWRMFCEDVRISQMCITDAGTTQDNFILPGLPISQVWLGKS